MNKAVYAGHPRFIAIHLPDAVKSVLDQNFAGDEYQLAKECASFLWKWSNRAKELASAEKQLHESLPEHLRHLLRGKRLLLLKEVLEDLQYPDPKLFDEIIQGFTLHGWMTESKGTCTCCRVCTLHATTTCDEKRKPPHRFATQSQSSFAQKHWRHLGVSKA